MKNLIAAVSPILLFSACSQNDNMTKNSQRITTKAAKARGKLAALTPEQIKKMNTTPVTAAQYPARPAPHYGPEYASISFTDIDPSETIGGLLTMKPAIDQQGQRVTESEVGITTYMIH